MISVKPQQRNLVSPWGREINAYVFVRSYQETEKQQHKSVVEALDSNDSNWHERELIIFPSHIDKADALEMLEAAHGAGFDSICASIIFANDNKLTLSNIWSINWNQRWTLPNPFKDEWREQVSALGNDLWVWICRALMS